MPPSPPAHIVAAIQNVPGVVWVELTVAAVKRASVLQLATQLGPLLLAPALPPARRTLPCPDDRILALDAADLTVSLAEADATTVP